MLSCVAFHAFWSRTALAVALISYGLLAFGGPSQALVDGCQSEEYEGGRTSSDTTLYITEFHISDKEPLFRCPVGGRYVLASQTRAASGVPLWFWFRIEGDKTLVDRLTNQGVRSIRLRAIFEQRIASDLYGRLSGNGAQSIVLDDGLRVDDLVFEAEVNEFESQVGNDTPDADEPQNSLDPVVLVTEDNKGLFDYRMQVQKKAGLREPGGYRVRIVAEGPPEINIVCSEAIECTGGVWVTFIK